MLLHLPDCVRHPLCAPLWGTSCFWFEGYNGDLTKLFHGTQNVDIQITHAVCIHLKIPEQTPLLPAGSAAKSYYKHLVEGRPLPTCREEIAEKVYVIGSLQRLDLDQQTSVVVKLHINSSGSGNMEQCFSVVSIMQLQREIALQFNLPRMVL